MKDIISDLRNAGHTSNTLNVQLIADLMLTTYCFYQNTIIKRNFDRDTVPRTTDSRVLNALLHGHTFTVRDSNDDPEDSLTLDYNSLLKSFDIIREKYPHVYGDIINETGDVCTGDAFMECAVFGEIIYG